MGDAGASAGFETWTANEGTEAFPGRHPARPQRLASSEGDTPSQPGPLGSSRRGRSREGHPGKRSAQAPRGPARRGPERTPFPLELRDGAGRGARPRPGRPGAGAEGRCGRGGGRASVRPGQGHVRVRTPQPSPLALAPASAMGSILSRRIAGVEDIDIQANSAYRYPPKSGELTGARTAGRGLARGLGTPGGLGTGRRAPCPAAGCPPVPLPDTCGV